jgi:hypothetical protein
MLQLKVMERRLGLVALVALAGVMALPALSVGDGFRIGGDVMTGLEVASEEDAATTLRAWNDSDNFAARINLTARYVTARGGVAIQYRVNSTAGINSISTPNAFMMAFGFGWFNLFDNMATVYAGKIGTPIWRDTGEVLDKHTDAVEGARLEIKPLPGLSFGIALPFGAAQDISYVFAEMVFGAGYTSDAFTIKTAVDLVPESAAQEKAAVAIAGGAKIPISPLTIYLDWLYRTETINAKSNNATVANNPDHHVLGDKGLEIGAKLAFELSDTLGASALAIAGVPGNDDDQWDGAEAAGDTTIALELQADAQISDPLGVYVNIGSDNIAYFDGNGLSAKLGASFAIADNIAVELYDKVNHIGATADDAKLQNTVQINFTWSF